MGWDGKGSALIPGAAVGTGSGAGTALHPGRDRGQVPRRPDPTPHQSGAGPMPGTGAQSPPVGTASLPPKGKAELLVGFSFLFLLFFFFFQPKMLIHPQPGGTGTLPVKRPRAMEPGGGWMLPRVIPPQKQQRGHRAPLGGEAEQGHGTPHSEHQGNAAMATSSAAGSCSAAAGKPRTAPKHFPQRAPVQLSPVSIPQPQHGVTSRPSHGRPQLTAQQSPMETHSFRVSAACDAP